MGHPVEPIGLTVTQGKPVTISYGHEPDWAAMIEPNKSANANVDLFLFICFDFVTFDVNCKKNKSW